MCTAVCFWYQEPPRKQRRRNKRPQLQQVSDHLDDEYMTEQALALPWKARYLPCAGVAEKEHEELLEEDHDTVMQVSTVAATGRIASWNDDRTDRAHIQQVMN